MKPMNNNFTNYFQKYRLNDKKKLLKYFLNEI